MPPRLLVIEFLYVLGFPAFGRWSQRAGCSSDQGFLWTPSKSPGPASLAISSGVPNFGTAHARHLVCAGKAQTGRSRTEKV